MVDRHLVGLGQDRLDVGVAPGLRAVVEAGVAAANERLSRVEQIKNFAILPDVWEPGGDQLTPTMKLKLRPIAQRYAPEIDALYAKPR